ncbi:hypothetical protein O181_008684 [Austropuccinia psidii MF-1]|uniref:Reverse transcriptase/retrotransposon-derived protein RNase H-like domain-containing protein n=1 Tax=Austropuccinia psidii MF-1 TaxID=1389203 RepID=A0A9Q3GJ37_9BASI|nr:hypothetical protein [Austropuccinia psidii MF-1]
MACANREHSDDDQDPKEEFLVEYQEETQLEIQDIQLEVGMPEDTEHKNLCKHTQDAQTFLVTPTRGMAYIHGTATKMTVCIDNSQHPLLIDSGAYFSIVSREYLENHFPKWEEKRFSTTAMNLQIESGKMTSIGTIIKERMIPHRKGNIRLNPEVVVLEDAHIQKFLLRTDYQRMYGIAIYNSKNRHITIGKNNKKKFSLDIYHRYNQDPQEEFLNEFKEGQLSANLTSKQKLSLPKILRKNRPVFSICEEPLGKIRVHDIELYLDVERCYPPMLRKPPYPASLEKTWEENVQYIETDLRKCTPINLKISLQNCNFGQKELLALGHRVSDLSLAIDHNKVAEVLQKKVPKSIKNIQSFLVFASYYRNHIKTFAHITSSLYKLCSKDVVFKITKKKRNSYEKIKYELINTPVLIAPDFELPFKLYIDAAFSQGPGAALHQRQIVDGGPREGVICYISRKLKDSEAKYGATQTELLCLVWALEKLHYYLEGAVFEV